MAMTLIDLFRGFMRDAQAEQIPPGERSVYFALLMQYNEVGRPEWFKVTDVQLANLSEISTRSITSIKNQLKQRGWIDFKTAAKRKPTSYKMTTPKSFTEMVAVNTSVNGSVNTSVNGSVNTSVNGSVLNREEKRRVEERTTPTTDLLTNSQGLKPASETVAAAVLDEHAVKEIMAAFSNNIHPVTGEIERDMLLDFCKSYGCKWTLEAIKVAVANNGRSVKYVGAILQRWQAQGFPSAKSATAQPQAKSAFDRNKPEGPDNRPPHIPKNWVWNGCGWEEPFVG